MCACERRCHSLRLDCQGFRCSLIPTLFFFFAKLDLHVVFLFSEYYNFLYKVKMLLLHRYLPNGLVNYTLTYFWFVPILFRLSRLFLLPVQYQKLYMIVTFAEDRERMSNTSWRAGKGVKKEWAGYKRGKKILKAWSLGKVRYEGIKLLFYALRERWGKK